MKNILLVEDDEAQKVLYEEEISELVYEIPSASNSENETKIF